MNPVCDEKRKICGRPLVNTRNEISGQPFVVGKENSGKPLV